MTNKPLNGKKVAVLLESEFVPAEIETYLERFSSYGAEVHLMSRLWGSSELTFFSDVENEGGTPQTIKVQLDFADVDLDEYAAIVMAANYTSVRLRWVADEDTDGKPIHGNSGRCAPAVQFFYKAMMNPKIIKGFPCHGLWILSPIPEVLAGRHVTCNRVMLGDVRNAGGVYVSSENGVVVDADIVTNDSASRTAELVDAIRDQILAIEAGQANPSISEAKTSSVSHHTEKLANDLVTFWTSEFESYLKAGGKGAISERPIKKIVRSLLNLSSYDSAEAKKFVTLQVNNLTGVSLEKFKKRTILLVASENGVWASELTVVASILLAAGYKVVIATETGKPPHMLSISYDPNFVDASLGISVVSTEEAELAHRYRDSDTTEGRLLLQENVVSLAEIVRPPLVADYLEDQESTMNELADGVKDITKWINKYDGIVIAGGSGSVAGFSMNGGLHHLLLAFNRLDKPIVAQCNGVFSLVQAIDPITGKSILNGKLATTHSRSHEYHRGGWGWAKLNEEDEETWILPGADGNPIIDSAPMVRNAVGVDGKFFSPPATSYAVAVDGTIITARTTPDGGPATFALIAILEGGNRFKGRYFIQDESGFTQFK